jgi:outer membrane protein
MPSTSWPVQDLTLRASQAYFDVLGAQDVLAAAQALNEANTQQLALAKKSFEVGTVTITDVHEAQSRADLSSAQVIAAESDLAVKRHALLVLTGKEPDALKGLRKGVALSRPEPADIQSWVAAAEASNLSVQANQLVSEIATREVERNRAGHLPTVDMVASRGNTATSNPLAISRPTTPTPPSSACSWRCRCSRAGRRIPACARPRPCATRPSPISTTPAAPRPRTPARPTSA